MSIRFQNRLAYRTPSNNSILAGQTTASVFFKLRLSAFASPTGLYYFAGRGGGASWYAQRVTGAASGYVRVKFAWVNGSGAASSVSIDLAKGSVYAVVMTLNGSTAKTIINNHPYTMPAFTGPTNSVSTWFGINHDTVASADVDHEIDDLAIWHGYVLTDTQIGQITDGEIGPSDITSGTDRYHWTLTGTNGATVVNTDAGLIDTVNSVAMSQAIDNGGSATWTAPIEFTPDAEIDEAWISTSGRLFCATFKSISSGLPTVPQSGNIAPSIKINSVDQGQTSLLVASGNQPYVAYLLPTGVRVAIGDTVTVSAPTAWLATVAGVTEAITDAPVTNHVGESCYRDESFVKTLRMGVNMESDLTTAGAGGPEFANLQMRLAEWSTNNITAYDANWKPTQFAGPNTYVTAKLYQNDGPTGIDSTGHPGLTGLVAVGWDDTNPSQPTTMNLKSNNTSTTVVTERTEYANPGTLDGYGVLRGVVRVYEITRHPSSTTQETHIGFTMANGALQPRFENFFILHEDDFTPGTPTVLDTSDRYRVSARVADQMEGVGSIRSWTPFTAGVYSNMWEREHLRPITDFCWSYYGKYRKSYNVRYTLAEPFDVDEAPYIYWTTFEADLYSATLAVACNATDTTLTITTLPGQGNEIIIGSRLFADSERIRVTDVVMSGLTATCTVIRGDNGTTPASHDAGPIQVGWRSPMITPGGNVLTSYWYHGYFVKLTTQQPHGLASGMVISADGTWPTFTYADGVTGKIAGYVSAAVVTGPNTLVCNAPPYTDFTTPIGGYTISSPVVLDPNQCYSQIKIPNQATMPYAAFCKLANQLDAPSCFFSLPNYGTRDCWRFAAEQILANLEEGRLAYIEIGNEVWNFYEMKQPHFMFSTAYYPGQTLWAAYIEQYRVAREVFDEVFGSRKTDLRFYINMLGVSVDQGPLTYAAAQDPPIQIDAVALAPYLTATSNFLPAEVSSAMSSLAVDEAIDLWGHSLTRCTTAGPVKHAQAWVAHMADYTTATDFPCELVSYEGFCPEKMFLTSATNYLEKEHDATYHPNFYIIIQDVWAALQNAGYVRANFFCAYNPWGASRNMWALYKGYMQDYGRGDGTDGKANNLHCLAVPGQTYSKSSTTSQDATNVSVMGAAFRDWNNFSEAPLPTIVGSGGVKFGGTLEQLWRILTTMTWGDAS